MDDSKIETNIVKVDINAKVVEKIYEDAGSPVLRELGDWGRNIVKAARLIGFPIDLCAFARDKFDAFLKKSLVHVDITSSLEPQLPIVGPILDGMKFQDEDSIVYDMLSNLFITSLDKNRINQAHPAFANIINQLSPDEAIIIYFLNNTNYKLRQHAAFNSDTNLFTSPEVVTNSFPITSLFIPENFFLYMNHLNSLNIAGIWQDGNQESIYANGQQTGVYINNIIQLTDFGKMLASASVPQNIDIYINKTYKQGATGEVG